MNDYYKKIIAYDKLRRLPSGFKHVAVDYWGCAGSINAERMILHTVKHYV